MWRHASPPTDCPDGKSAAYQPDDRHRDKFDWLPNCAVCSFDHRSYSQRKEGGYQQTCVNRIGHE